MKQEHWSKTVMEKRWINFELSQSIIYAEDLAKSENHATREKFISRFMPESIYICNFIQEKKATSASRNYHAGPLSLAHLVIFTQELFILINTYVLKKYLYIFQPLSTMTAIFKTNNATKDLVLQSVPFELKPMLNAPHLKKIPFIQVFVAYDKSSVRSLWNCTIQRSS